MTTVPPAPPAPGHPAPPLHPERPEGVEPLPAPPHWSPLLAFMALLAAFAGAAVFGAIALAIGGDFEDPPPGALIGATIIQDLVIVASAIGFAWLAARPAPWQFGLRPAPWKRSAGLILAAYVVFIALSGIWAYLIGIEGEDNLPEELGADESTAAMLAVGVLVCVIAPLTEEFFFRGYFFPALKRLGGFWPGALITGIVFGAIHLGSSGAEYLVPLAILGFLLCALYQLTGSLYPCIVLHTINNCVAYSVAMDWSWEVPLAFAFSFGSIALVLRGVRSRFGAPPPVRPV